MDERGDLTLTRSHGAARLVAAIVVFFIAIGLASTAVDVAAATALSNSGGAAMGRIFTYDGPRQANVNITGPTRRAPDLGQRAAESTTEARSESAVQFAAETEAAAAPRFIANSAGDILNTSRVTIPEGKFGYLLENPAKAGTFAGADATIDRRECSGAMEEMCARTWRRSGAPPV